MNSNSTQRPCDASSETPVSHPIQQDTGLHSLSGTAFLRTSRNEEKSDSDSLTIDLSGEGLTDATSTPTTMSPNTSKSSVDHTPNTCLNTSETVVNVSPSHARSRDVSGFSSRTPVSGFDSASQSYTPHSRVFESIYTLNAESSQFQDISGSFLESSSGFQDHDLHQDSQKAESVVYPLITSNADLTISFGHHRSTDQVPSGSRAEPTTPDARKTIKFMRPDSSLMIPSFSEYQPSDQSKRLHQEINNLCNELNSKLSNDNDHDETATSSTSLQGTASLQDAELEHALFRLSPKKLSMLERDDEDDVDSSISYGTSFSLLPDFPQTDVEEANEVSQSSTDCTTSLNQQQTPKQEDRSAASESGILTPKPCLSTATVPGGQNLTSDFQRSSAASTSHAFFNSPVSQTDATKNEKRLLSTTFTVSGDDHPTASPVTSVPRARPALTSRKSVLFSRDVQVPSRPVRIPPYQPATPSFFSSEATHQLAAHLHQPAMSMYQPAMPLYQPTMPAYQPPVQACQRTVPDYHPTVSPYHFGVVSHHSTLFAYQMAAPMYQSPVPTHPSSVFSRHLPVPCSPVPPHKTALASFQSPVPAYHSAFPAFQTTSASHRSPLPSYQPAVPSYQPAVPSYQPAVPFHHTHRHTRRHQALPRHLRLAGILPERREPEGCSFSLEPPAPTTVPTPPATNQNTAKTAATNAQTSVSLQLPYDQHHNTCVPTAIAMKQNSMKTATTDTQPSGSYQLSSDQYTSTTLSLCPGGKAETSVAECEDIQAGSSSLLHPFACLDNSRALVSTTTLHHRHPAAESTRLETSLRPHHYSHHHQQRAPAAESTRLEAGDSSRHLKLPLSSSVFQQPDNWTNSVWENYNQSRRVAFSTIDRMSPDAEAAKKSQNPKAIHSPASDDPTTAEKTSKRQQPSDSQTSGSSGGSGTCQPESSRRRLPPRKRHCRNLLQRLTHNLRRCGRANVSANMSSADTTVCYLPARPAPQQTAGTESGSFKTTGTVFHHISLRKETGQAESHESSVTSLSEADLNKTITQLERERGSGCMPQQEAELARCLHQFLLQPQNTLFYKMTSTKRKQMSKLATTCYVKAVGSRFGVTLTKTTLSRAPVARDILWLQAS